jgi:ADP-ribose pyrophosphatase
LTEEKTLSTRIIFDGRAVKLRIDTVKTADGRETTREIVEHSDCIAVIVVDENDNVLLEKQYRKAIEKELLEIPAGGIDPGEDAAEAVRREMQEETGYLPGKVEKLGGFYSTPGYCTEYLHLYLATELTPSRLYAEDTAGISLIRVPVKDIPGLLTSGRIEDAKSIAGLHMYLEHRKTDNQGL